MLYFSRKVRVIEMRKESINDEITLFSEREMMSAKNEEPQYFARELS